MSLGVFVTYVLERTCRPALISEFGRAFSLGKLLRPGTVNATRFENQEQGQPGAATGVAYRSVPVPGHSNVRPVVVSELGSASPLGECTFKDIDNKNS